MHCGELCTALWLLQFWLLLVGIISTVFFPVFKIQEVDIWKLFSCGIAFLFGLWLISCLRRWNQFPTLKIFISPLFWTCFLVYRLYPDLADLFEGLLLACMCLKLQYQLLSWHHDGWSYNCVKFMEHPPIRWCPTAIPINVKRHINDDKWIFLKIYLIISSHFQ